MENHDLPKLLPDLLPELNSGLETAINANDFASVNNILATVNSSFKKFRYQINGDSDPILLDLEYCVDNFGAQLLITVESISRKINAATGSDSVATLRQLLKAQRLCCSIFYSLNFLHVQKLFEDNADIWIKEFKNILTVSYPAVKESDEDGVSLVDDLRASVCENITLYMEKKEKLLQKHLNDFVEAVCNLLVVESSSERLTVTGIKFLTIVSNSVHNELLAVDKELFMTNYIEFIKRDMEWSDLNTRRKIACKLLNKTNKEKIRAHIHHCLALFAENPASNWKYKECAIYLVISLKNSTDLIDIESFFRSVIIPELHCQDVNNTFPILKASALKFFTVFHVLIPKDVAMHLLSDVVRYIGSDVNVVHSYAATCLENLLLLKDNNGAAIYTSIDIDPIQRVLIFNLLQALEKAPFCKENQYVMKCIMRVLQITDISSGRFSRCIFELTKALNRVCFREYPKNPVYCHFLFESIATIVRRSCEKNPSLVKDLFHICIKQIFWRILDKKVTELYPYAFIVLAQLFDLDKPPFPPFYMQIFDDVFMRHDKWENFANVPALVLFIQSILQQVPNEFNKEGRLRHLIAIINKLMSSPVTEEDGFHLLNTVIGSYAFDVIAEYMNEIWDSVLTRLHNSKTPRVVRCVIVFMSRFVVKHGVQTLVDMINYVDANLFQVIFEKFWIPNLKTITGYTEVKVSAVASIKLLCESPLLLDPETEEIWGKLFDAIVTLLSQPEDERVDDDNELDINFGGYEGSKFLRLQNVGKKEEDPLKEIEDPKQFLVAFPEKISCEFRGIFPLVVMRHLSPGNQAALVKLCNSYNIAVV